MVNNVVHATYSETYDLNTAVNELSVLGIHTPQAPQLKKMFRGFFENYKKLKILGCNLKMVCASQQSLDPSQMGLEAGQVDPRDILNPILFKACTGEYINQMLDVIYHPTSQIDSALLLEDNGKSLDQYALSNEDTDSLKVYYEMLADDSWRKSHPQSGLEVSHLVPMVHKVVTTRPFKWQNYRADADFTSITDNPRVTPGSQTVPANGTVHGFGSTSLALESTGELTPAAEPTVFLSNGVTSMPPMDTVVPDVNYTPTGGSTQTGAFLINNIPRVYMGCIVLPPAILQSLYFRMTIVWHLEFSGFRPAFEVGGLNGSADPDALDSRTSAGLLGGASTYFELYHNPTVAEGEYSSFTASGKTEVSQVMERVG